MKKENIMSPRTTSFDGIKRRKEMRRVDDYKKEISEWKNVRQEQEIWRGLGRDHINSVKITLETFCSVFKKIKVYKEKKTEKY